MEYANRDSAPTLKAPTAARQGVVGHNVRYVLGFSIAGVIAAFVAVAWYYGSQIAT